MIVYLGHIPGIGAYGVLDLHSAKVLFRGTLSECMARSFPASF